MIGEFSVKVKSSNKKATVAFVISLAISVVIFAISFIIDKYSGLVGNLGLISLVVAVLFYTKYIAPVYYYDIMCDSDGDAVLVVRMMNGKRQTTLCRIGLAEIIKMESESASERRAHKTETGVRVYSYSPTLMPDKTYRLYTRSRYERAEIILEISDELAALLARYVSEAREKALTADDE